MENKITYHEQNDIDNVLKLREVLKTLPPFCRDYFRAIDATTTTKTRISYAYDIRIFFQFLLDQNPMFKDKTMKDFTVDVLDQIKAVDLEEYEEYLKVYKSADSSKTETNGERGVKRKISALRSFYAYYYKHEMITTNPSVLIDVPKIHDKSIIRLDTDEVALLLDYIEHCGDTLTGQKRMYYEKTKDRDLAIVTLLLGTGIRVSECVGLDVEDVDFKNNGIKVTRACTLLFYPASPDRCPGYRESGEKICQRDHNYQKDHASQAAKYIWHSALSGNRRYLSCSGCSWT